MALQPIQGKNVLLEMQQDDTSWLPIFCGTDLTFNYEPEFITKTGPNSPAREYQKRIHDCSMNVTGLTKIANDTVLSFFFMMTDAIRGTKRSYRARFTDDAGTQQQITMDGFVGPSSVTGPVNDFSIASLEIRGTGGFAISTPPISPGVITYDYFSDWWTTTPGNAYAAVGAVPSSVNGYTLVNSDIVLEVDAEGMEFDIVTSAPGNRQARWNTSNLRVEFQNAFFAGATVFILFKRAI